MWWIIGGIALIALFIYSDSKKTDHIMKKMAIIYPAKLKPLLKEGFPDYEDLFTTSFCSLFWKESLALAKEKTNKNVENDDLLVAFGKIYTRDRKNLDEVYFQKVKKHFPPQFAAEIENNQTERDKFNRVIELANSQTIEELNLT